LAIASTTDETDIVSVAGIARTGIAEPDEQQHGNVNS